MRLIFFEERPMAGRIVPIHGDMSIGRDDCDVIVPDPEVSRCHAAVRQTDGSLVIEDLGSTNGTFVNGLAIKGAVPLREGDAVRFGNTVWHVRAPGSPTQVTSLRGD